MLAVPMLAVPVLAVPVLAVPVLAVPGSRTGRWREAHHRANVLVRHATFTVHSLGIGARRAPRPSIAGR